MARKVAAIPEEKPRASAEFLHEIELEQNQLRMRVGFSYRRMAMWLGAVLAFFIVSGIALILAFGYRIDWRHRLIEHTSVIEISGVQAEFDVEIALNGEKIEGNQLPIRIAGLRPRTYTIRITRVGSMPFEETVVLHENERKRIQGIILPDFPLTFISYDGSSDIFLPSNADRNAIEVKNSNELWYRGNFLLRTSQDILDARHYGYKNGIVILSDNEVSIIDPEEKSQDTLFSVPDGTEQIAYDDLLSSVYVRIGDTLQVAKVYETTPVYLRFLPVIQQASPKGH